MTAQVISLEAYRLKRQPVPRLADLETEEEKEKAFDDKLKRRFYLELDTWPKVFQRRIRARVEDDLEQDPDRHNLYRLLERRLEVRDGYLSSLAEWLHDHGQRILQEAKELREAKARGIWKCAIRRREQDLETAKSSFLWVLWQMGWQKVDRKALREMAEKELPRERERLVESIAELKERVAESGSRVRAGVYIRGPKKGEPLSEARLKMLNKEYEDWRGELASKERRLAYIDSIPTALRAWGFHFSREER